MMSTEEQILSHVDKLTYDIYTLYQSDSKSQIFLTDFSKEILTQLKALLLPILEYRNNLLRSTLEQLLLQKMPQYPEPDWPDYYEEAIRQLLSEFDRQSSLSEPDTDAGHVPTAAGHVPIDAGHAPTDAGHAPYPEYPDDPVKNTLRRILQLAYPQHPIIEHYRFKNLVFDYFIPHINLAVECRPDAASPNTRQHDKLKLYCRLSGVRHLIVTSAELMDPEKLIRKLTFKDIRSR
jgi:hypothetical protein